MTELVDVIKVEVTLHHCNDGLRIEPLRELFRQMWPDIVGELKPCSEGEFWLDLGDRIRVRWSHTGLHEIPEESGGDN